MEVQILKNMMLCPHPLSLDLVLINFWLFTKVSIIMQCKCFELVQDRKTATKALKKMLMKEDL